MKSRTIALRILNRLEEGDRTLDSVLDRETEGVSFDYKKDRALLQAIVFGVLRWRGRLDWIVARFSKTPFDQIEPNVLNILRIGLFQIVYQDRIPVAAAVNTSVEMAKTEAQPWIAKYVNAVLRNAATSYESVPYPDSEKDPVKSVAVEKSFPEAMVERWMGRYGAEETRQLCDAFNEIAPIAVRCNVLRITREKLVMSLEGDAGKVWKTAFSPTGVCLVRPKKPVDRMAAFKMGWFQVQDEAAQLATLFLAPRPGETVLDACAGLGGKTGHIAQLMENRGRVGALDNSKEKLQKLAADMDRQFVSIVKTQIHDLEAPLRARPFRTCDRILLDAPCSGLGVLRRNPDAKWRIDPHDLARFADRQIRFLENLAPAVRPGGTLVYAVCSLEPEETVEVVRRFLAARRDFSPAAPPKALAQANPSLFSPEGYFSALPHKHGMDGFFAARFSKKE